MFFKKKQEKNEQWYKDSVIYHIYPLSFKDSDGDGFGDISGIIEKLDYFKGHENSLDVDALWLSPFQKTSMFDFGYDISDYYSIDPIFGDAKIFKKLITQAHKRGLKVLMDFVANHTSIDHPWFEESRSSIDNPKRDWYVWRKSSEDGDGGAPNNWLSVFGGSAWTLDEKTNEYYLHSFLKEQPDLNWRNPEVRKEMEKVLDFWIKQGIDGFRIDAINHLMKDPEFKDDPNNPNYKIGNDDPYNKLLHENSQGNQDIYGAISFLCDILEKYGNKFMVSEAYLDVPKLVESYKACNSGIHIPFNFNLIGMPWSATEYKKFIDHFESSLGENDWPNYVLGNHDRSRIATRLGIERSRVAALLIFTLRGVPFIYQGDEIGMEDGEIKIDDVHDPFEISVPGLKLGRDPERTPMQWDSSPNAGFSSAERTWLPVSKKYQENNVQKNNEETDSTLNLYRFLIKYRKNSEVLKYGQYVPLEISHHDIFAFIRELGGGKVLVIVNFSNNEITDAIFNAKGNLVCNSFMNRANEEVDLSHFTLGKNEACIIELHTSEHD